MIDSMMWVWTNDGVQKWSHFLLIRAVLFTWCLLKDDNEVYVYISSDINLSTDNLSFD